jgi:peptide deformylase
MFAASVLPKVVAFQRVALVRPSRQVVLSRSTGSALFSSSKFEQEVDPGKVEGTDLQIVKYPHPSLRAQNAEITEQELKDGTIAQLAKEMFLLMYAAEGVGLAAPQVGVNKRLMVYNPTGDKKKWLDEIVMVNPQITEFSEAKDTATEGCLSFPEMSGDVERAKWIKVEAVNLKGKKIKKKFQGWEARIFQHEYDHLDGTVYIDRLSTEGRAEVQPKLDELVASFGEGGAL